MQGHLSKDSLFGNCVGISAAQSVLRPMPGAVFVLPSCLVLGSPLSWMLPSPPSFPPILFCMLKSAQIALMPYNPRDKLEGSLGRHLRAQWLVPAFTPSSSQPLLVLGLRFPPACCICRLYLASLFQLVALAKDIGLY